MLKKIPFLFAVKTVLLIVGFTLVFHILVLSQIIPYNIVWGARIQNKQQMFVFEAVSLSLNFFMLFLVLVKGGYITWQINHTVVKTFLWVFSALFALNTLGNLASNNVLETVIFTPLTLLLSMLFVRLALEPIRVKHPD